MLPFSSTLANVVAIGTLIVGLVGGAWALKVHYDNGIIAQQTAAIATASAAAQRVADARTIAGLQAANAEATARLETLTQLEGKINATPRSTVCQASAPLRALVLGMRGASGQARPARAAARPGVALPASATTAR